MNEVISELKKQAIALAYALGIDVYISAEGKLTQNGPGELTVAPPGSKASMMHGGERITADVPPAG
jgi:hypothetical protein